MTSWELFATLAPAGLPPFMVPLALGALVLALAAWLVVRARVPRKARPAGARGGPLRRLGRRSWRGLRGMIGEALAVGRYVTTRREWRYRQSWVAMLGERGAGKSSITESISVGRRETLLLKEQRLAAPDTEWIFFNRGVLIDIDGAVANGAEESAERRRWSAVLERLDHYRPERPVDAAVLTLSAETLLRAGGAELHALAERCYRQLWEMQKRLDLTFPVYLVIGHGDAIPGFGAFWRAQPERLRGQIFGWSTPHALTNSFSPEWIDEAFTTLDETLHDLQLNAAAGGSEIADADEFFLFPQRFAALAAPLKVVVGQIFRSGALHEDFYFRGLYCTGAVEAANPAVEQRVERTDIAFVDELFDERVFREINLARPTRQGILSRNRLLRRFQIAMVALFAALVVALAISSWSLNSQITAARKAHQLIAVSKHERGDGDGESCSRRATVYELLENVARIDLDLSYWSIPASWFDRRVNHINRGEIARNAFGQTIFPNLACRLEQRARQLVEAKGRVSAKGDPGAGATEEALAAVRDYAAEAERLEANLQRFRRLARFSEELGENFTVFAELVSYLYQAPLPPTVIQSRGLLRASLAQVDYETPLRLPDEMERRVAEILGARAEAAAEQLGLRLHHGTALLRLLEGQPSLDDIRRIYDWLGWVRQAWLDTTADHNPCATMHDALAPRVATLRDRYHYPDMGATVTDRFDQRHCYAPAKEYLTTLRIAPYGPLFAANGDGLGVTPWLENELAGFHALLDLDFMRISVASPFQCRLPLQGWREDALAEADRYLRQYEEFAQHQGLTAEHGERRLYERMGRVHLAAVVDELFTKAQWREGLGEGDSRLASLNAAEETVERKSDNLQRTLAPLVETLDRYRRLGFTAAQSRILQCARDYAAQTLGGIETLAERSRLYEVEPNFGQLAPDTPYFDLGTAAQTKAWLARQLARGQVLGGYAEPFVTFLKNSVAVNDANRATVTTAEYWSATIDEINRQLQFKDPTSQPALLEAFVSDQMGALTQANCHQVLGAYARPAYGDDLFSRRRDQLTFLADWYCRDHASASLLERYLTLAKRFNDELAGRFPFGPLTTADADPAAVRRFFLDYAAQRAAIDESLQALSGPEWSEVRAFVASLDRAADLFGATFAAADGDRPMELQLGFRHLPERSPGSDQVVAWRFDAGLAGASYPNGETAVSWRFGDPVALDLSWAELSPVTPMADGEQPDLGVSGRRAGFAEEGPWSLLRLVARHRVDHLGEADQVVLGFSVPVKLSGRVPRQATPVHARMYLALNAGATDPATQAKKPLALPPGFPTAAPLPR